MKKPRTRKKEPEILARSGAAKHALKRLPFETRLGLATAYQASLALLAAQGGITGRSKQQQLNFCSKHVEMMVLTESEHKPGFMAHCEVAPLWDASSVGSTPLALQARRWHAHYLKHGHVRNLHAGRKRLAPLSLDELETCARVFATCGSKLRSLKTWLHVPELAEIMAAHKLTARRLKLILQRTLSLQKCVHCTWKLGLTEAQKAARLQWCLTTGASLFKPREFLQIKAPANDPQWTEETMQLVQVSCMDTCTWRYRAHACVACRSTWSPPTS
jgi:hypothetical protein